MPWGSPVWFASNDYREFVWVSSPDVAEAGVRGLENGKGVVVPGTVSRLTALSGQFTPRSVLLAATRRLYRLGDS